MNQRRKLWLALSATVLLIALTASLAVFWRSYPEQPQFELSVLDVGQGDAVLIEAPGGQVMLVDGGPDKKVLRRLGEELPFWERRIDLIVLTHPHEDHLAGLNAVIERYEIGAVMVSGPDAGSPSYKHFLETIKARGIPLHVVERSEELALGEVKLHILFPLKSVKGKRLSNLNDSSIVMKATYGETDILLTGDAETAIEKQLLASGDDLTADILKAGHHGSETSSGEEFLKAVKPQLAIISSGVGNSYGHPSPRILKRYERFGIPVRRTDQEGTVHVRSDGKNFYILQ